MAFLEVRHLSKSYAAPSGRVHALKDLSFSVEPGEFVSLVGKSGCGKTTLLRLLGGLEKPEEGTIHLEQGGTAAPKIGMVFQEPRLLPWKTVEENLRLPLRHRPNKEQKALLEKTLDQLELANRRTAYPGELSGGMAQRVALGRALCYGAELILMDEPLSALDYFTRRGLQNVIEELYLSEKKTILFVTHHVEEALRMGGRVLVLREGELAGDLPVPAPFPRGDTAPLSEKLQHRVLELLQPQRKSA